MNLKDAEVIVAGLLPVIRERIEEAVTRRVRALPPPERGAKGEPGADADPALIAEQVAAAVAALPKPQDGKSVDLADVRAMVLEAVAALPPAKDGIDGKDVDPAVLQRMVDEAVAKLPPAAAGRDGTSVDPLEVRAMVDAAVSALPPAASGAPGKDADPEVVAEMVRTAVAALPPAPAGRDGKDADPALVADLVDRMLAKAIAELPRPKDGQPGKDGDSVHPDTVARMVREAVDTAVAQIRLPKDGENGRDAVELDILPAIPDGRSCPPGTWATHAGGLVRAVRSTDAPREGARIEDLGWRVAINGVAGIEYEPKGDGRTFVIRTLLTDGKHTEAVYKAPTMIYRGVWKPGAYEAGDVTTRDGSMWHANVATSAEPGTSKDWQLSVRRGNHGNKGDRGEPGKAI